MFRSMTESVFIHLLVFLAVTAVVYSGVQAAPDKPQPKTVILLTSIVDTEQTGRQTLSDRIKIPDKPATPVVKHSVSQPKRAVKEIKKSEHKNDYEPIKEHAVQARPEAVGEPVPATVSTVQVHDSQQTSGSGTQAETKVTAETAGTSSGKQNFGEHATGDKTAQSDSGNVATRSDSGKLASEYSAKNYSYILALIKSNLKYPYVARINRWTGRVVVRFNVADNGCVSMVSIVSSSGHSVLDDMVKNAVNDSAPFPHPPVPATIIIPVSFSFNG